MTPISWNLFLKKILKKNVSTYTGLTKVVYSYGIRIWWPYNRCSDIDVRNTGKHRLFVKIPVSQKTYHYNRKSINVSVKLHNLGQYHSGLRDLHASEASKCLLRHSPQTPRSSEPGLLMLLGNLLSMTKGDIVKRSVYG